MKWLEIKDAFERQTPQALDLLLEGGKCVTLLMSDALKQAEKNDILLFMLCYGVSGGSVYAQLAGDKVIALKQQSDL